MTSAAENFYEFTNNWWLKDESVKIPPEYPRWGSFMQLHDESLKNQIKLLQEVAEVKEATVDEKKLGLLWAASMGRFTNWENGKGDYSAINDELKVFSEATANKEGAEWFKSLATYFARCQKVGISYPLRFDKESNLEDSENVVLDLSPGGISLPSRDYYLDDKFEEQRAKYMKHLNQVAALVLDGQKDFAERVMRFETKLARISMKTDQSRQFDQYFTITNLDDCISKANDLKFLADKTSNYTENAKTVAQDCPDREILTAETCSLSEDDQKVAGSFFEDLVTALGLKEALSKNYAANYPKADASTVAASQFRTMLFDGDYFRRVMKLLLQDTAEARADVSAYLQYNIIHAASSYCTKDLDECFFDFYSRQLNGQKEQKSSEKRSVSAVNAWLGELLGKIYVSRFFSDKDKQIVQTMVSGVLDVMQQSLKSNDWLTSQTKEKALAKLNKFTVKIGFPDKWKDFSKLVFEESDSLFSMKQKVKEFDFETEFLGKVNSPKDRTKWEMTPQTVNAYFHPMNNEIVFPAAILQPPFYSKELSEVQFPLSDKSKADKLTLEAVNFGAIGAVIAHEITHGYDDQGRKFDHEGNINDWWQKEDTDLFTSKTDLMAKQAEQWTFEAPVEEDKDATSTSNEPKIHRMNGQLTMGENLADLGGLSLACQALIKNVETSGHAVDRKDLFQSLFKSWSNVWKTKQTAAYTINQLATDPHAPSSFRTNLVSNIKFFYEAFEVKENDPMFIEPEKRVQMW